MLPWSLLAHSPARGALPMAHRVALVFAMTLWLAGYSMPSLVTRRRRRVTYFAFPFGGRAKGRVYRQCRARLRVRRRLPPAERPPNASAGCVVRPQAAAPESKALPSRASVWREE